MRKLVSLGFLALALYSLPLSLFAGYPECDALMDILKEAKVYGWCNAWHDAETDEEKARIRDRILERTDWDELPWVDSAACPCWDDIKLARAACRHLLTKDQLAFGVETLEYDYGNLRFVVSPTYFGAGGCLYQNAYVPGDSRLVAAPKGEAEHQQCLDDLTLLRSGMLNVPEVCDLLP